MLDISVYFPFVTFLRFYSVYLCLLGIIMTPTASSNSSINGDASTFMSGRGDKQQVPSTINDTIEVATEKG